MQHNRSQKITLIPFENLALERPHEHDPLFHRLVTQQILGRIKIALTRLDSNRITSGFYKQLGQQAVLVSELMEGDADRLIPTIRRGARPRVEVYWNPLVPGGGGYVSPDTEATLAAYRKLAIRYVPTVILKPKKRADEEGAVWLEQNNRRIDLAHVAAPLKRDYRAYRIPESTPFNDYMTLLIQRCQTALVAIQSFHVDDGQETHYHQMIHAVVRRHSRSLNSIEYLVSKGRLEHAYLLTRASYEAFLNFYLDWLFPEFFGPRLQLLSIVRMNGFDESELEDLGNFRKLLETTSEKARVSTLGDRFYRAIYAPLSRVAHQSYTYIEREAPTFADEPDDEESVSRLALCLNVLTAGLVERVLNEVGVVEPE